MRTIFRSPEQQRVADMADALDNIRGHLLRVAVEFRLRPEDLVRVHAAAEGLSGLRDALVRIAQATATDREPAS